MRSASDLRHVSLGLDTPETLPSIKTNRYAFERVLYRLLSNAIRSSPERSEVRVEGRYRPAGPADKEGVLTFSVVDGSVGAGGGSRYFRKFQETLGTLEKSAGIGIALASRYARRQGGTANVRRDSRGGTSLTMTLPLEPSVVDEESDRVAA